MKILGLPFAGRGKTRANIGHVELRGTRKPPKIRADLRMDGRTDRRTDGQIDLLLEVSSVIQVRSYFYIVFTKSLSI